MMNHGAVSVFCTVTGHAEVTWGCAVHRESQHDVRGERHSRHRRHGPGQSGKVCAHTVGSVHESRWEKCGSKSALYPDVCRLIEPLDLAKAVHLYQQAAGVFEVSLSLMASPKNTRFLILQTNTVCLFVVCFPRMRIDYDRQWSSLEKHHDFLLDNRSNRCFIVWEHYYYY